MKINSLKTFLILVVFFCLNINLFGQTVKGKVLDAYSSEELAYANVILLTSTDSTFVVGDITNINGVFSLTAPNSVSNYLLNIQYIGYEPIVLKINSEDMGEILLTPSETFLNEVTVTASAKTFRMENGGISAYIQNSRLKDMGRLTDILGQLPFVTKDQDSYTVFGKGSPVFYINNRLVRNQMELQQISSKDIKKVSVITNPGAEYDSPVSAVIKIETIRPVGEGISGDVLTYNRYNSKFSTLNNLWLNYRKGNFDIFGSFGYADMSFPKDRNITNTILGNNTSTIIKTDSKENDSFRHIIPQIGFNYLINKDHSVGSRYEYYRQPELSGTHSQDIYVSKDDVKESQLHSDKLYNGNSKSHYVNIYYNGVLNNWLTVKMDADYKTVKNENGTDFENLLENGDIENVRTNNTAASDFYAAKIAFTTPVWNGKLTYGAEISHTKNQQDSYVIENDEAPGIVPSNNDVKQNLTAGFFSYSKVFGNLSGELGLRYENVSSEYNQNGNRVDEQSKKYQNLFPNIRLSYKNNKFQGELSYRNTIRRPGYSDLKSGIVYLAPYSYNSGNPLLQPQYQQSLTFMLMWRNFTFMTVYSHYKDRYEEMLPQLYLENSILLKPVNIEKSHQLAIKLNYAPTFGVWKPNMEIGMEKGFIEYGIPPVKYNKPLFSASLRNNIQLLGWQFGVDINARTKGYRGFQYQEDNSWSASVYINKSFLNDKLSVNITANDIFNTVNDRMTIKADNINVYYENSMYRRNIQFRVAYRFNSVKNRYKGDRASDELNRL